MASSTGVLPFLRGADLSHNDFEGDKFPKAVDQMKGLKWLKLSRTKLDWIPEEFRSLERLEKLILSNNKLASLHGELTCLKNLKTLVCSRNNIASAEVPVELFAIESLTTLDLSHNNLEYLPRHIESCRSLTVLNLSHNKLTNIAEQLFIQLTEIVHLDLSDNQLKTLPPQIGRLTKIQVLNLNNNPLREHKMRKLERLTTLRSLYLSNTQRDTNNMPTDLADLIDLVELDLSCNKLTRVPDFLCYLRELKRLNISENKITKVQEDFGNWWPKIETLNMSRNELTALPSSLCKLCSLKRLYLNDNMLTFEGLPAALGKLHQLEVLMVARNNLELIPESIFRCGRLKKLVLTSNKLITLPDTIHLLYDLEVFELSNNPDLMMPPKPVSEASRNSEFYNIDFSLNTQLQLAGDPDSAKVAPRENNTIKDPIARKLRLRRRAKDDSEQETNQAKVLKGMKDLVREKDSIAQNQSDFLEPDLKPKRWDEILERPPIDYSDLFDETTGQLQGLTIWEIENFLPSLMDASLYGKFYDADCYIVLSTEVDDNLALTWKIFYWIGSECSLDKKACSAIHAVGLRNHLNAQSRTIREEQGEESDEFLALFPDGIDYVKGARTASGFYTVEETEYAHRMFRLHEVAELARQLHLETVALSSNSLDSRFVFVIDIGTKIFVWNGVKSKNTTKQKARLLVEKLNKDERKSKAELVFCDQGDEHQDLLNELNLSDPLPKVPFKTVDLNDDFDVDNYKPLRPILYQIGLGMGYIELLQKDFKYGRLLAKFLVPDNVYVLDCFTDVFVWLGRKSPRLFRKGALKLAQELFTMVERPAFATITSCLQGTESHLFKTKFKDWDDVIAVDYTRTAESVSKTGANLTKWMSNQQVKIDLASLFAPRQPTLNEEEAQILIEEWNDELELIDSFILDKGKRFVNLPEDEFGHFHTQDCYVFLCRYFVPQEEASSSDDKVTTETNDNGDILRLPNGVATTNGNGLETHSNIDDDYKCVVYFWQGREASKMGWLTFTFSLQKKFEALFGDKFEVVQMHQQQENIKFLSHFKQNFIIHKDKRQIHKPPKPVELYHIRSNSNPLTLRCIEIDLDASKLNSGFCYLLRTTEECVENRLTNGVIHEEPEDELDSPPVEHSVCSNNTTNNTSNTSNNHSHIASNYRSHIYVWIGSKADESEAKIAEQIARDKFAALVKVNTVDVIREGDEPAAFWSQIGGRKDYEQDSSYMEHTRLFRCSNDKGYFSITEKCTDFCQDDLSDDDIMILDNGTQVFLWIGPKSSEVEVKLAYKSAQVYVQNLRLKDKNPRQLMLTFKGKESRKFTKCFHGWSEHKSIKDPRGDEAKYLRRAYQCDQEIAAAAQQQQQHT